MDVLTADDSATSASGDHAALGPQTIQFMPGGGLTQAVLVTVNGDLVTEPDETYFVRLTNALNAGLADSIGVGTITNDDAQPSISIGDVAVAEGDVGTTPASFPVTLSRASVFTVTMLYATADGSATVADNDYVPVSPPDTLVFAPGDSLTKFVTVLVNGDTTDETAETFTVTLSDAVNGTLGDATAVGQINNDDSLIGVDTVPVVSDVGVAHPNPLIDQATMEIGLRAASVVRIRIYDASGRLVRTVLDGIVPAGVRAVTWDGHDERGVSVGSGVYLVRTELDGKVAVRALRVIH